MSYMKNSLSKINSFPSLPPFLAKLGKELLNLFNSITVSCLFQSADVANTTVNRSFLTPYLFILLILL